VEEVRSRGRGWEGVMIRWRKIGPDDWTMMNVRVVVYFSHRSRVRSFRMLDEYDLLPLILIMLCKFSLQDTGDVHIAYSVSLVAGSSRSKGPTFCDGIVRM
jgi:hypothetical protein